MPWYRISTRLKEVCKLAPLHTGVGLLITPMRTLPNLTQDGPPYLHHLSSLFVVYLILVFGGPYLQFQNRRLRQENLEFMTGLEILSQKIKREGDGGVSREDGLTGSVFTIQT